MSDEGSSPTVRYEPGPGVVAEWSGDKVVVLHPDGEYVSTLNSVAGIVWECLPAERAVIVSTLSERFGEVDLAVLEADLERFLDDVLTRGLVVVSHARD